MNEAQSIADSRPSYQPMIDMTFPDFRVRWQEPNGVRSQNFRVARVVTTSQPELTESDF